MSLDTVEKLREHHENESFRQLCHSSRLALNSVMIRLKQKYDVSLKTTDEKMTTNIEELEKLLGQLTDMLVKQ